MTTKDHAFELIMAGISVLPVRCDGTKQPTGSWKEWTRAIPTEKDVEWMFRGRVGIGIVNGQVSGNKETLDVDAPELVEPFETAVEELTPGLLARLPTVATPRNNWGGRHYHYRIDGKVAGNTKLAQSELRPQFNVDGTPEIDQQSGKQRMAPETLIETRGEAGYVIAPGSPPECHVTGREYRHISGPPIAETPVITVEEHRILWHVARSFNRYVDDRDVTPGMSTSVQRNGVSPGDDFNTRVTWSDVLVSAGWTKGRTTGDLTAWCRPGKSKGVSATTGCRSSAGTELLCVFSTNAYPFDGPTNGHTCSSYSKFAAYAVLNHGGDFTKAAKELAAKGYGTKPKLQSVQTAPCPIQPFRPFPTEALPSLCAQYVQQAAESIDCDESMIALPLLGTIAAAIGNSCRIQLKRDYSEPSVLWAAVVCESGTRKSAALESPVTSIRRREGEEIKKFKNLMSEYDAAMQNYKVAASKWQRKGHKDGDPPPSEPEKPVCRRFTVSDVTSEALAVRLEQNPRGLLLIRDELAGFFTGLNQYKAGKGADEAAYLAMHGARALKVDRKNPDKPFIYVPMANLSVIGAIQPAILRRLFTRERMESGMAARFLLACPPSRVVRWKEKWVEKSVEDRLATMFDFLLSLPMATDEETNEPTPIMLPLTPEAKQLWIAFHDEHAAQQAELHGDLSAAWAKLTGYAARLSLIVELAAWATSDNWDRPTEVGREAVRAGITLANWFSEETKRIYAILSETDEQRQLRELVEYVGRHGGAITPHDLARGPRLYRGNPEFAEAELQRLERSGVGHWEYIHSGDRGGRPTRRFRLKSHWPGAETPSHPEENEGFSTSTSNRTAEDEEGEWVA